MASQHFLYAFASGKLVVVLLSLKLALLTKPSEVLYFLKTACKDEHRLWAFSHAVLLDKFRPSLFQGYLLLISGNNKLLKESQVLMLDSSLVLQVPLYTLLL
jgi:hypothetical protein